eukprot:8876324-Heterocapsa_arctica.AAC.1
MDTKSSADILPLGTCSAISEVGGAVDTVGSPCSFEDEVLSTFVRVDKTYSEMRSQAVKSGYQVLHAAEDLHCVQGYRIEGGGFA